MRLFKDGPFWTESNTMIVANASLGYNHHFSYSLRLINVSREEVEAGLFNLARTESGEYFLTQKVREDNRAVVFLRTEGGFRGGVGYLEKDTTGNVLAGEYTQTACESVLAVLCLLSPGEQVTIERTGRGVDDILVYSFDGEDVHLAVFPKQDYLAWKDIQAGKFQIV